MYHLEYAVKIHQKEMARSAEEAQLIREALAALPPRQPFYRGALAALGRRLVTWGKSLETRYARTTHLPADKPLEPVAKKQVA
jgi:hypothetical protein